MAPATERLRSSGRVLRRALFVVSNGVSYGLAPRPRGGVAAVDAPLSLAKASGMETGELGAGKTWAPPKEGRDSPVARGGCTALHCTAIRCDAMRCYATRCTAPSPAKQPRPSRSQERAVRLSEELVGPGDDWTACAMVEVGTVEREDRTLACRGAIGRWQPMAANGRGERDLAGRPAPCLCRRLAVPSTWIVP